MSERTPSIPDISTQQMIQVDRLMIEEYGITLIQMMENAGRNLAEMARQMCILTAVTLTLALPKTGLLHPQAAAGGSCTWLTLAYHQSSMLHWGWICRLSHCLPINQS